MNFSIRKFYDTAIAEPPAGGAETEVKEQPQMSVAEAMAKHGKKSDENSALKPPIDINAKAEVKTEETKAAPAKVEEPVKTEPEAQKVQKEEPKKEEKQPIVAEQPKVQSLDEVLKNQQPNTILKALGFADDMIGLLGDLKEADPKMVGIIQAYQNGTLKDYVRELSTDYKEMSAEEVMRNQLRREYPRASAKALDALYDSEVVEKFKLDPEVYTETEIEKGRLLLEAKADRYRDEFTANQEKFLLPSKPEPKQVEAQKPDNREQEATQQLEEYAKELGNDPYTKDIFTNKKIYIGEGDSKYGFAVEPQELVDILANPEKWVSAMWDKEKGADGKEYSVPKTQHQLLVAAVAKYGMSLFDAYATHWKGLGGKEVTDPIENASIPGNTQAAKSEPAITSMAQAMAIKGKRVDPV